MYGPLSRIDGPPPVRRPYGLLQAAETSGAGVRLVTDADAQGLERWGNGVETWPYPLGPAYTFDQCAATAGSKHAGQAIGTLPQFGSFAVYFPFTCSAMSVGDHADFRTRITTAFSPVEDCAVERVLLNGDDTMILNPRLADGTGTFPLGNGTTSPTNAIAMLEQEIARQGDGRLGVIHASPMFVAMASGLNLKGEGAILRTINGTPVIPGAGYADGANPTGRPQAGTNQEWIYASGQIEVRRSPVFVVPDTPAEATDRSANTVTYRAERQYVISWDTSIHAAVLADRCKTTC